MSEPPEQKPKRSGDGLVILAKVFLFFVAGAVVLTVLVFGTCLLLMKH